VTTAEVLGAESPEFDDYADTYDEALASGLSVTGESKQFYASGRATWLARRLLEAHWPVRNVLDFGCGIGSNIPLLFDVLGAEHVHAVDVSTAALKTARSAHARAGATFATIGKGADATFDMVFCNGVFHHIAVEERRAAAAYAHGALVSGGLFALWENNPWNIGTRYVMSRIPFDRNAITLTPPETRQLLLDAGFDIVRTDFLFYFPHFLRVLRPLERLLTSLPLGGQYLVLARKR
jgi:SAM-dependent methyltransferase